MFFQYCNATIGASCFKHATDAKGHRFPEPEVVDQKGGSGSVTRMQCSVFQFADLLVVC